MKKVEINQLSNYRTSLMGYAALSIFFMHIICAKLFSLGGGIDKLLVLWGSSGVDIFLLLSGIGIACSLKRVDCSNKRELLSWINKRFIRLWIPYMFIIIPFVVWNHDSFEIALQRLTTLYFWINGNDGCWFVSFILVMYFVSPIIQLIISSDAEKRLSVRFLVLICSSIFLLLISEMIFPHYYEMISIGASRIPIYMFGMKLGNELDKKIDLRWIALFLIAAILQKLINVNEMSFVCLFLKSMRSIFIVILECFFIKNFHCLSNIVSDFFGSITLEFYLIHLLILGFLRGYGELSMVQLILYFIVSVVLSVLIKKVSNLCIGFICGSK